MPSPLTVPWWTQDWNHKEDLILTVTQGKTSMAFISQSGFFRLTLQSCNTRMLLCLRALIYRWKHDELWGPRYAAPSGWHCCPSGFWLCRSLWWWWWCSRCEKMLLQDQHTAQHFLFGEGSSWSRSWKVLWEQTGLWFSDLTFPLWLIYNQEGGDIIENDSVLIWTMMNCVFLNELSYSSNHNLNYYTCFKQRSLTAVTVICITWG